MLSASTGNRVRLTTSITRRRPCPDSLPHPPLAVPRTPPGRAGGRRALRIAGRFSRGCPRRGSGAGTSIRARRSRGCGRGWGAAASGGHGGGRLGLARWPWHAFAYAVSGRGPAPSGRVGGVVPYTPLGPDRPGPSRSADRVRGVLPVATPAPLPVGEPFSEAVAEAAQSAAMAMCLLLTLTDAGRRGPEGQAGQGGRTWRGRSSRSLRAGPRPGCAPFWTPGCSAT